MDRFISRSLKLTSAAFFIDCQKWTTSETHVCWLTSYLTVPSFLVASEQLSPFFFADEDGAEEIQGTNDENENVTCHGSVVVFVIWTSISELVSFEPIITYSVAPGQISCILGIASGTRPGACDSMGRECWTFCSCQNCLSSIVVGCPCLVGYCYSRYCHNRCYHNRHKKAEILLQAD